MTAKKLSELTDEELLQEAKKRNSDALINATFIGFLLGIILFSLLNNSLGFFTLIPLYLAYKLSQKNKYDKKELDEILKERKLK